jgi:hypothetical protein
VVNFATSPAFGVGDGKFCIVTRSATDNPYVSTIRNMVKRQGGARHDRAPRRGQSSRFPPKRGAMLMLLRLPG